MLGGDLTPLSSEAVLVQMSATADRHDDPVEAVRSIRALRRRELLRIAVGELFAETEVADVGAALSRLTDATLQATLDVAGRVEKVLAAWNAVQVALPDTPPPAQADAIADVRAQLGRLLPVGFVTATGAAHLADVARYLSAIGRRLDRLAQGVNADRERMLRVHEVQQAFDDLVATLPAARAAAADVRDVALQLRELVAVARFPVHAEQLGLDLG